MALHLANLYPADSIAYSKIPDIPRDDDATGKQDSAADSGIRWQPNADDLDGLDGDSAHTETLSRLDADAEHLLSGTRAHRKNAGAELRCKAWPEPIRMATPAATSPAPTTAVDGRPVPVTRMAEGTKPCPVAAPDGLPVAETATAPGCDEPTPVVAVDARPWPTIPDPAVMACPSPVVAENGRLSRACPADLVRHYPRL